MKSVNQLLGSHPGQWVAFSSHSHEMVGVDKTARGALLKAQKKGERFPHLIKAPDSSIAAFIY